MKRTLEFASHPGNLSLMRDFVRTFLASAGFTETEVDLMVLGDDYSSTPPTVGILAVAASGHVSADGTTIQTDPGEGISELTWLAVRKGN